MNWTKLPGFAKAAKAAARIAAAGAVGMAALAGAVLIIGPALPGHVVAPWWVSAQPRIQAIGGPSPCEIAASRYRKDADYVPPRGCLTPWWYQHFPDFPPPDDAPPPPPPGDAP